MNGGFLDANEVGLSLRRCAEALAAKPAKQQKTLKPKGGRRSKSEIGKKT